MSNDQAASLRELMNKTKPKEEVKKETSIYAFIGPEGSGNTTLVSNLASLVAKEGKKVIVLDFSAGILTTDLFFNIIPNRNIVELITEDANEKELLLKARENVYIVYGNKALEMSEENKNKFKDKLDKLIEEADIVIADIEGTENLGKLMFLLKDSEPVFVMTPDTDSIQETYYGIKYLKTNMGLDKARVVLNKSEKDEASDRIVEKLDTTANNFLEIKVEKIGYICRENEVKDSIKRQKLFTDVYPDLRSTSDLIAVRDKL